MLNKKNILTMRTTIKTTKSNFTSYGLEFRLAREINGLAGYNNLLYSIQTRYCGFVVLVRIPDLKDTFGITDNEYDLDEIYSMIENGKADTALTQDTKFFSPNF